MIFRLYRRKSDRIPRLPGWYRTAAWASLSAFVGGMIAWILFSVTVGHPLVLTASSPWWRELLVELGLFVGRWIMYVWVACQVVLAVLLDRYRRRLKRTDGEICLRCCYRSEPFGEDGTKRCPECGLVYSRADLELVTRSTFRLWMALGEQGRV